MEKVTWPGGTLTAPLPPVMVSCGDMDHANILTIAWTGILNSTPPKTYISVRPNRYSHRILLEKREFAINLTTAALVKSADYCGIFTGAKVDKFAACKLTKEPGETVSCPLIGESPLALECRITDVVPLGTHDMFIADITAIRVEKSLLDETGKLHLERAGLAAFAHGAYYELGKRLGTFGFSAKKPTTHKGGGKKPGARKGTKKA